jgi:hypothetical protein
MPAKTPMKIGAVREGFLAHMNGAARAQTSYAGPQNGFRPPELTRDHQGENSAAAGDGVLGSCAEQAQSVRSARG